jgi:hypothetical protein
LLIIIKNHERKIIEESDDPMKIPDIPDRTPDIRPELYHVRKGEKYHIPTFPGGSVFWRRGPTENILKCSMRSKG